MCVGIEANRAMSEDDRDVDAQFFPREARPAFTPFNSSSAPRSLRSHDGVD